MLTPNAVAEIINNIERDLSVHPNEHIRMCKIVPTSHAEMYHLVFPDPNNYYASEIAAPVLIPMFEFIQKYSMYTSVVFVKDNTEFLGCTQNNGPGLAVHFEIA